MEPLLQRGSASELAAYGGKITRREKAERLRGWRDRDGTLRCTSRARGGERDSARAMPDLTLNRHVWF